MTKANIIKKFHLYMDDTTELSSSEESDLFDKILAKVYADRPWEFLKKPANLTIANDGTNYYVTVPSDFRQFLQNYNYTDDYDIAQAPVIFVGSGYTPYKIVSYSDRRQYRLSTGYAYLDVAAGKIIFTGTPNIGDAVEFDYKYMPAALATGESPVFPSEYHDIVYHGMCVDEFVIEQSDKAKSYAAENKASYDDYMAQLAQYNANLIQMAS